MYKCFIDLQVYPPSQVVKIDDTEPGIAEGVAAGCVTEGVALSGNYVGMTPEELKSANPAEVVKRRAFAEQRLRDAGANYIIDTIAELPALLNKIQG